MKNQEVAINNDSVKKPENTKGFINNMPQTTKNYGHSKIKGFSFQIENKNNKEENVSKDNFQIVEDEYNKLKNAKIHKSKISMNQGASGLLSNANEISKKSDIEKIDVENKKVEQNQIGGNLNGNPKIISETPLNITDLIKDQNYVPLSKECLKKDFEKYEAARHSAKSLSVVKAFAANTHQGTVRKYNEDRVSIILNIVKPNTFKGNYWPSCSFFAVFDGHGGSKCADFLKDNLHNYVSM